MQHCRNIDAALGHLITGLKQHGIYDAANIVVVSDHGMTATSEDRIGRARQVVDVRAVE